jgi:uncharacterized surface protein with fasciclin (FAS1) repeats
MKSSLVLSLAFAGVALAQSLTDVLSANNDTLSALAELLSSQTDLVETLGQASNITILAPNNDALSSLLDSSLLENADAGLVPALLTYHVLNGTYFAENVTETPAFIPTLLTNSTYSNVTGGQVVEAVAEGDTVSFYSALKARANVTQADVEFDGGVIHIINEVLMIPANLSSTAIQGGLSAAAGALIETDLVSALEEMEEITVFVPNNDAFASIANLVGNLSTDALASILQYHVVEGVLYSSDLENGTQTTAGGEDIDVVVSEEEGVFVDSARVVIPDILIANGVVHVIDGVLNPNATNATPNPSTTTPAFTGASTASDGAVPFTSDVPTPTEEPTALETFISTETSDDPATRPTAVIAMGALFGGAALLMNGI